MNEIRLAALKLADEEGVFVTVGTVDTEEGLTLRLSMFHPGRKLFYVALVTCAALGTSVMRGNVEGVVRGAMLSALSQSQQETII